MIASSSVSMKFSRPAKHTARVPTTFSLATKPVTAAAASCQDSTPTMGTSTQAKGPAMEARMELSGVSATAKLQLKVCMICTAALHSRMMVAAFTI